jgi:hypothetical protein
MRKVEEEPVCPAAIAGTDPSWVPRTPDLRFGLRNGRLCSLPQRLSLKPTVEEMIVVDEPTEGDRNEEAR